jgi:hypothetical protein
MFDDERHQATRKMVANDNRGGMGKNAIVRLRGGIDAARRTNGMPIHPPAGMTVIPDNPFDISIKVYYGADVNDD